jgi:membrane fusion protein, heavy metal efflux system
MPNSLRFQPVITMRCVSSTLVSLLLLASPVVVLAHSGATNVESGDIIF